ncbi:MAG: Na(+)-translocating NADH-quinone reductase subunit A [Bacteroidales bacterium]|nr:Na(+)-translocating NADH-quinone reductase subunit A [Bacteroidales bacterium]
MNKELNLKRGLDLQLAGAVTSTTPTTPAVRQVALVPDDYPGFIPKLEVKEGDVIAAAQPLMHHKADERIKLVSPVAGTVASVVRGERRKILRVVVSVDPQGQPATPKKPTSRPDDLRAALMASGLWAQMRQRPYDIVPDAAAEPRDIFVTAFDSAPLAGEMALALAGKEKELAAGVKALKALTRGEVYVSVRPEWDLTLPSEATVVKVHGPHPAGNAGVQAANLAPVNKGETIWTLDAITLCRIGELVLTGLVDWTCTVAITGSEVKTPGYVKCPLGSALEPLLKGNIADDGVNHRIIAGNVLTGVKESLEGFLRYPYQQVTVIPEGDDVDEFMGWASMAMDKLSTSRSFPSHFLHKLFKPDARLHGGRRAMIMSGEYDKVMPMDILPEYLLKAILSRDIDKMEALGIYEVAPEDFALCEFVDASKIEVQKAVREGLDYLRKELS